ncbi:MAG: hypothetical protein AB2L14_18105 [Candidatus Xenobiia bacterium LiM19]
MAAVHEFTCKECGYNARVCGGYARGCSSHTTTVSCHSCEEIMDVSITVPGNFENLHFIAGLLLLFALLILCGIFWGICQSGQISWLLKLGVFLCIGLAIWAFLRAVTGRLIQPPDLQLRCPHSKEHPCEVWNGECPRCKTRMKKGRLIMNWD